MSYDFDLPHAGGTLAGGAGIQPWSSPEQYVIFSIDRPDDLATDQWSLPAENNASSFSRWLERAGIGFKRLIGHYTFKDGRPIDESAWIVNARDWRTIAASGWIDGQESVLHLGPYDNGGRAATLYYCNFVAAPWHWADQTRQTIGTFQLTTKQHALKCGAWTFDPSTAEYYVAE